MRGSKVVAAVVMVVVGLFTFPAHGGITHRVARQTTAQQETNTVNGGADGGAAGGGGGTCPEFCTFDYTPVCGSDGVTYTNPCSLTLVTCSENPNLTTNYVGACFEDPFLSPAPAREVTADGAGGTVGPSCQEECPSIFAPVCGSDGVTYSSDCQLRFASCLTGDTITVAAQGPCDAPSQASDGGFAQDEQSRAEEVVTQRPPSVTPSCSQQCTRIFFPVCGSDGNTYNSVCLLEVADCESRAAGGPSIIVVSEGACGATIGATPVPPTPEAATCSKQCTRIFLPVCGSNGVTYNSVCLLEIADCESRAAGDAVISLASEGPCGAATEGAPVPVTPEAATCSKQCFRIFHPVCGSDGVTYSNVCLLEIADCESRAAGGPGISLASEAACGATTEGTPAVPAAEASSCPQECTRILLPVCGSDGLNYNNLCLLQVADCESRRSGGAGVSITSEGTCGPPTEGTPVPVTPDAATCSKQCTRIFLPVCGSDGVTYNSVCLLEIADCESRAAGGAGISLISEAACERREPPAPARTITLDVIVSCRRLCSRALAPVCGSDGVTHDNECLMEDASCRSRSGGGRRVYLVYDGACDPMFDSLGSSCRGKCSDKFEPVCGSDGNTYSNECVLDASNCGRWARKQRGVYLVDGGPCDGYETRPSKEFETSPNIILASSLTASPPPASPRSDSPSSNSPASNPPSSNSPFLDSPSSNSPPSDSPSSNSPFLDFPSFNSASSPSACPEACTREFRPVCGTDGMTYNNPCALQLAHCRSRARGGVAVEQEFLGPCVAALPRGPDCDVRCDRTYEPVCGTDGETYTNQCLMEHADCLNPFGSITAASDGPCGGLVSGAPSGPSASSSEESEERDESTSLARSPDTSFVLAV